VWHACESPVIGECPAMIGADKARCIAFIGTAQSIAAVTTDVEECAHGSGTVAHHENGILAHIRGQEITRSRDLAVMTQEQPTTGEDAPYFRLIDFRFDEDPAADHSLLAIDETRDLGCHEDLHDVRRSRRPEKA